MLLGNREAEQALLTRVGEQRRRQAAVVLPLLVERDDAVADETADAVAELLMLGFELESGTHETCSPVGAIQRNAFSPVKAWPRISWCISGVPS